MSFIEYVIHYFSMPQIFIYLALAMGILIILLWIVYLYSKSRVSGLSGVKKKEVWRVTAFSLKERLYEFILSATSMVFFLTTYYLIERFLPAGRVLTFWQNYRDYLLLVLMVISCFINAGFDRYLIRLKYISKEDCATGRVTAMFYILAIFLYIKFIYQDNNYDRFIVYFLGLMVGRFIYFDASISDFVGHMKRAWRNMPIMCMTLAYLGAMCLYGFKTDYLITHIGVLTNIFITHIFMCVCVVILSRFHIFDRRILKANNRIEELEDFNEE